MKHSMVLFVLFLALLVPSEGRATPYVAAWYWSNAGITTPFVDGATIQVYTNSNHIDMIDITGVGYNPPYYVVVGNIT
jgi:hypothetical protein